MKTKDNSKQRPHDAIDPNESDGGIGRDAVLGMNAKLRGLRDDWYHIDVALWHYIVHVYIGSRQMMISTMQCENCVTADYQLRKLLYKADCDLPVLDNWFKEDNQDLIIKNFSGFFVFLRNGNKFTLVNVDGLVNKSIENANKMNLVANNIAVKTK